LQTDLATKEIITDSIEISNSEISINSASGLRCMFPANSLLTNNNNPVDGKVAMESLLLQKKGEMIRMDRSTVSDNYVIASEGMFFLRLKKEGNPLKLRPETIVNVQYNKSNSSGSTKLFYSIDSGQGAAEWQLNTNPVNSIFPTSEGYQINTNRFAWINNGYVIDSNSQNTSIHISLPKQFTNANTIAWLVFKNYQSAVSMSASIETKKFICTNIPPGKEAAVIILSRQVNDYYLASKNIVTPGSGGILPVQATPVKTSFDVLLQYLESL
jgi:hypothetical protein